MGFSWGGLGRVALKVAGIVVPIVGTVEQVLPQSKGTEKKAVALALVCGALPLFEDLSGVDLNDAAVQAALSNFIDATVSLKNAIAAAKQIKGTA